MAGAAGFRLLLPLLRLLLRGWWVFRLRHRFRQGLRSGLGFRLRLRLGLLPPCGLRLFRLGLLLLRLGLLPLLLLLWGFRLRVRLWLLLRLGLRLGLRLLWLGGYRVLLLCGCGVILAGNA